MKFMKLIFIVTLVTMFFLHDTCSAYQNPFVNDDNYIKVDESDVFIMYLDKKSVQVKRYEPPIYEIFCDTPLFDKYAQRVLTGKYSNLIRYNYDTKQIWIFNRTQDKWYLQDIYGVSASFRNVFNLVFYTAYNIYFYGTISLERISIGGLRLGDTREEVKKIYGEPSSSVTKYVQMNEDYVETWKYGDSLILKFYHGYLNGIRVSKGSSLATPDGLKVGMDESMIQKVYGEPWVNNQRGFFPYSSLDKSCWLLIRTEDGIINTITVSYSWNF